MQIEDKIKRGSVLFSLLLSLGAERSKSYDAVISRTGPERADDAVDKGELTLAAKLCSSN
jgi:hypothetical protein